MPGVLALLLWTVGLPYSPGLCCRADAGLGDPPKCAGSGVPLCFALESRLATRAGNVTYSDLACCRANSRRGASLPLG